MVKAVLQDPDHGCLGVEIPFSFALFSLEAILTCPLAASSVESFDLHGLEARTLDFSTPSTLLVVGRMP